MLVIKKRVSRLSILVHVLLILLIWFHGVFLVPHSVQLIDFQKPVIALLGEEIIIWDLTLAYNTVEATY